MVTISSEVREFLSKGPLGHLVTLDPDGTPHVTLTWAGFDGDDSYSRPFPTNTSSKTCAAILASRSPSKQPEHSGPKLRPYLVVEGRARLTEGGALAVMDSLAEVYIGPGSKFGWRDAPPGFVIHVTMPCATPSPGSHELLHRIADGAIPVDEFADQAALDELVRWGWAFARGGRVELSGAGLLHAGGTDGESFLVGSSRISSDPGGDGS